MLKRIAIIICFLFFCKAGAAQAAAGNTYALVIGVAKYLDPQIGQLQYANRDAEIFAKFLQSKAGGSVPQKNIRLLIDSAATTGAVYDAMYWLKSSCQPGDLVYFYFSGHGDLENITMYNNGFLICYDSPPFNYVKLALSIDYVNDIANTLSKERKANVVLITDACHSGKLTEKKFKGNFLASNQLRKTRNSEIRITSSSTNELSNEKADWGGGRGVFSYYLVNGLTGWADRGNKGLVNVEDIRYYLDSALKHDRVLGLENIKQTPEVNGDGSFILSRVDSVEKNMVGRMIAEDTTRVKDLVVALAAANMPQSAEDVFFNLLGKEQLEIITDSTNLNLLPKNEMAYLLIRLLKNIADPNTALKLEELEQNLKADKSTADQFNSRLATVFDAVGQQVITRYLKGDAAELEKRRYYNSTLNNYDVYPKMYEAALKLTSKDNIVYYTNLQVKLHYFTGVAMRLKMPVTLPGEQKPLIAKALAQQKQAVALEEYAAYIYNELGILYSYQDNIAEAEKYFRIASERSPEWALPLLNLADIYIEKGKLNEAKRYADSAFGLQPDLQDIYVTYGSLHEANSKLLLAQESYQKSIKLNDRHFIPFQRLGYVYMHNLDFDKADSMFFEAGARKKGFYYDELANPRHMKLPKPVDTGPVTCTPDPAQTHANDLWGQFALGYTAYRDNNLADAERAFKRVITLDKKNPLAYHYLGRSLFEQQRWQEAEPVFMMAIENHLEDSAWFRYYDSISLSPQSTEFAISDCAWECLAAGNYEKAEDFYLMAQAYEQWNHFEQAEVYYRKYIELNSGEQEGHLKLSGLFEKTGRYNDAENHLLEYNVRSNYSINGELVQFYQRVNNAFPGNGDWLLKAGNFMYNLAKPYPDHYFYDMKWVDPLTRETVYKYTSRDPVKMPAVVMPRLVPYGTKIKRPKRSAPVIRPFTEGVDYFRQALVVVPGDELVLAGVHAKLGDLYQWQNLVDSSIYFYQAAVEMDPRDAGKRIKLADAYVAGSQFSKALVQLDSLYVNKEIGYDKLILMADWYMQDGRFTDAGRLLKEAAVILPFPDKQLVYLKAKLAVYEKKYKDALASFLALHTLNNSDPAILYNIASLRAKLGNKEQALDWLEKAVAAGFNYTYVLDKDPAWNKLRKASGWIKITAAVVGKTYESENQLPVEPEEGTR